MPSTIELRHLRYFLAVAETSNFTRAAERLKVSQSAVSQQIKELEQSLGAALFDRLGKTVRLTHAGTTFRANAEMVLRKLDEAFAVAHAAEGVPSGHLHIGAIPVVCLPWIPEALERFGEAYPGVTVSVHERSSDEVETEVEAGRLDFGVGVLTYTSRSVAYHRITSVDVGLLVPSRHPLAERQSVPVEELDGARLVLLPEEFQLREMVEDSFRQARCRPRVAFELNDIDVLLGVVARTGVPTLLPSIVLQGRKALGLRAVPLVGESLRLDLGFMWPVGAQHGKAAVALAEQITAVALGAAGG